jgi:Domain of unknown function (DUF4365)
VRSPMLGVQSKCTARNVIRDAALHFSVSRKNYNDLRPTNLRVPRILVVHCIPSICRSGFDIPRTTCCCGIAATGIRSMEDRT